MAGLAAVLPCTNAARPWPSQSALRSAPVSSSRLYVTPGPLRSVPVLSVRTVYRRWTLQATQQQEAEVEEAEPDNILPFCSLDSSGRRPLSKLSLGEKEQEFLNALRSFYDGEPMMGNEEFDNLKEELLWEGSKVAVLSGTEQRFLEASLSYAVGKPMLSDTEWDELKRQLRKEKSTVVAQGPRCSIRSKRLYSDADPDYLKMTLLNLPAVLLTLGALFSVDDITGFEITKLVELPEPYGIIFVWGIVLPAIFVFANTLTNLAFQDNLILKGTCPNCGQPNTTYFGDILTVKGNRESNQLDCVNCKAKLTFNAEKRSITAEPPSPPPPPKGKAATA